VSRASDVRAVARERLADEVGTIHKEAPERVALVYPSPYAVAMSSLGYQTMYREINAAPARSADRAFLPDDVGAFRASRTPLFTYETGLPVGDYPVVALSIAFELELAGVIESLELAGIPPLAEEREERHPFVLGGGPLTFSNPVPLAPYCDAVLLGEAEDAVHDALDRIFAASSKSEALETLAREVPSAWVPSIHGETLVEMGRSERLPAFAQIVTPHTELRSMFLIEGERGCSRGCQYCVMRRSTNGGMRIVPIERILELVPEHARRVGLVGAAISDHPKIAELVETLAEQGREVGLSSLRPDRLNDRFVAALRKAGHKTLTTAMDAPSQRLRDVVERKAKEKHILRAAEHVRTHGFDRLKLYMIIGLPGETDEDVDELVRFSRELSTIAPVSLGIAPFVSKRNTPLDGLPFAGIDVVEARLRRLRRGVQGKVDIRATSARWAWVEHALAQGGADAGRAVLDAVRAGGKWRDYRRALGALPPRTTPRAGLPVVV
jgi:radical SAM superfamily enzyme YgiQ (UPF0313 family)